MEGINLAPGEAVVTVLNFFEKENKQDKKFNADREIIHKAFFNIKKDFPDLLYSLSFVQRGLFPESFRLDQAISNMEAGGLLTRQNQRPRFYEIQDCLHDAFDKYVKPKLDKAKIDKKKLRVMAKKFIEEMKKIESVNDLNS